MTERSPIAGAEFFQFGYVTSDLEAAVQLWKEKYGVPDFFTFDTRDMAPPGSNRPGIKVALGYQGAIMIELIEPDAANPGIYGDALKPGGATQLHHLGYLVDPVDLEAMKQTFEAQGAMVPTFLTGGPDLLYADTRFENGLYAEMVARTDYMMNFFKRIPKAA